MTMKCVTGTFVAGIVILLAGCQARAPVHDTTPPGITVLVSRGRGGNLFRSADGPQEAGRNCIKVAGTPAQLVMIAGDPGGVAFASIKAFPGTIDRGTLEVTPPSPEGSYSIRSARASETLEITLTPPAPGTVRTGATAILEVDGDLPIAITALARDYAGNVGVLPEFGLHSTEEEGVICRGDR